MTRRVQIFIAIFTISTTSLCLSLMERRVVELGEFDKHARGSNPNYGVCTDTCASFIFGYPPCTTVGASCEECVFNGSTEYYDYPGSECPGKNTTGYQYDTTVQQCGFTYLAYGTCIQIDATTIACGKFISTTQMCLKKGEFGPSQVIQESNPVGP